MTELDVALSIDDQLYAKFQDLNRQLQERAAQIGARERIREVRKRTYIGAGHVDLHLKILEVHGTDEGLVIIVE